MLFGLDAQNRVVTATDSRPFLVAGFLSPNLLTCSGGIGPVDPNPLGYRGCPPVHLLYPPGRLGFVDPVDMPTGDGPIVLLVHSRDPAAANCLPENVRRCAEIVVIDGTVWFGDAITVAAPIGPASAIARIEGLAILDSRPQPDGSIAGVTADVFTVPIVCPEPWPALTFRIHGDPRLGLVTLFASPEDRAAFTEQMTAEDALSCLATAHGRPAAPRWIAVENMLLLAFPTDDEAAAIEAAVRAGPGLPEHEIPIMDPAFDQGLSTLFDYLEARRTGQAGHAWGQRLIDPVNEDGPGDAVAHRHAGWLGDMTRRGLAGAVAGRIELLPDDVTAERIGEFAAAALDRASAVDARLYRVTYDGSTDPDLAVEEFVAFRIPDSTFRDWSVLRIAGAAYPDVVVP